MYTITTNASGTRTINVNAQHLETISEYNLFADLIDSNGFVDDAVLDKLRLNIRSLLETGGDNNKQLLSLCFDVIYHPNMKAFGLQQLIVLYINWKDSCC